ncbi:MAG: hypothetical protein DWH96_02775 [Planctomycetota bacterium]|nr:MAG: hypothetical protein DWH96_02775 [Planctomycetota bacterium]
MDSSDSSSKSRIASIDRPRRAVAAGKRPARVGPEYIAIEDYHGLIRLIIEVAHRIDRPPAEGEPADHVHALMERLWTMHRSIVGG